MSLAKCFTSLNKGKQVFSDAEMKAIRALANQNIGNMSVADAEKFAVQSMLDEAIADQQMVSDLIREGMALPAHVAEDEGVTPGQAKADVDMQAKKLASGDEEQPVPQAQEVRQVEATIVERFAAEKAPHVNDLQDQPTGWKRIEGANNDSVTLVSRDGKKSVRFVTADKRSGAASVRMNAEAHAYAIDNQYKGEPLPQGELVSQPLMQQAQAKQPASENDKFNSDLDSYLSGELKSGRVFVLGTPGKILSQFGLGNLEIQMSQSIVKKGIEKHSIEAEDLRDMPQHVQNPLAVFASKSNPDARILLTEIDHPDGNLVVALHAEIERGKLVVHDIRSIHPKSGEKITQWVEDGLLLGVDKNKGRHLLPATPEYNSQGGDNEATSSIILYETSGKGNEQPAEAKLISTEQAAQEALTQADAIEPAEPAVATEPITGRQRLQDVGQESRIGDFGRKVIVRKDTSMPTGKRSSMPKSEDDRPAWARKYIVMPISKTPLTPDSKVGKWQIMKLAEGRRSGQVAPVSREMFDTEQDALNAIPLAVVSQKHRAYSYETTELKAPAAGEKLWGIYRNITDRKRAMVKGEFKSQMEAMQYMAEHPEEIIEYKFGEPERPWLDHIERIGESRRTKDVTKQMFEQTFAPGGVVYGNWLLNNDGTVNADGQALSNYAYDALLDMAEIIGVPPKALFLNGDLALGLGADGKGGKNSASAHYSPDKGLINLTKIKGAGTVAHELWHAMDHYFAKSSGYTSDSVVKNGYSSKTTARPKLIEAMKRVRDAMMYAERSTTTDADMVRQRAQKRIDEAVKSLDYHLQGLRRNLTDGTYNKGKKVATAGQLMRWDDMAAKLRDGDMGAEVYIENPSKMRGAVGYKTGETMRTMNALYKSVAGRSFLRQDHESTGRRMHWIVKSIADNKGNLAVKEDVTSTAKGRSDYFIEAKRIDGYRVGDYWSTPEEMGARAFESFIFDKLTEKKQRSDYLVYAVENRYYAASDMKPYPEGEDRARINVAFDNLFAIIQTKETDKGVAIFNTQPSDAIPESKWPSVGSIVEEVDQLLKPFATEIPVLIRDTLSETGISTDDGNVASGAVIGGRIHLFRDGLTDHAAVVRTLWHELLHFGFRRFMTEEQYIAKMGELYMQDGWVRGKATEWMKSAEAKKLAETKKPGYVRARAVDEALAELAEIMQTEPTGYQNNTKLAQAKRAVSEWIAKLADFFGFKEAAQAWREYAAQKDARDLIVATFAKLREGAPPSMLNTKWHYSDPAFMVAWHEAPLSSRRIHGEKMLPSDYVVPETPEFDGAMGGDLAYTPQSAEAKGIEQLPIRLSVGIAREAHRGYGIMHMEDNAKRDSLREAPTYTEDQSENFARHVTVLARTFDVIYGDSNRIVLASSRYKEGLVVEERTDATTGERFYSVVTLLPAQKIVWGNPVWRAGRNQLPTDRSLQPGASELSPEQDAQRSDRQMQRNQTSKFILPQQDADRQPKKPPVVTHKKRRSYTMGEVKKSQAGATGGQTVESVRQATAKLRASWHGFKQVRIVQSVKQVPNDIYLRALRALKPIDQGTEGIYDPASNTVYLIADNLASPGRAVWVAAHEVVGHGGIRMLGGDVAAALNHAAKNGFVAQLAKAIAADRKEAYSAKEHVDEALAELAAATITGNVDAILERYGVKVPVGMRSNLLGMIKRVVDAVRQFIGRVTSKSVEEVSDGEVLGLISQMKDAAEGVEQTAKESEGYALASRGEQSPESFARMFLQEFTADNDLAFKHGKSTSRDLATVLNEVAEAEYVGDGTRADERDESGADYRHFYTTQSGSEFRVYETDSGKVWIDVSRLEKGGGGQAIYAAVANYAYNTGKKFIGDPDGLTDDAVIRRTSNMLSSALQFGTTKHLEPSNQQINASDKKANPIPGVEPLDWSGSDIDKVGALAHTLIVTTQNLYPEIKRWRYDFDSKTFRDGGGEPISAAALGALRKDDGRGVDDSPGLGESTARRVVLAQSLVSEAGQGVGRRSQILEELLRWGNRPSSERKGGYPDNLTGLFSKSTPARTTGLSASSISDFRNDQPLKRHPDYKAAKAGDIAAAVRLVSALVKPESIAAAREKFGDDVAYLPVMAQEASGKNQIPNALAIHYAAKAGGKLAGSIFQTNKAYHTGADAMERMIARSEFGGEVISGQKYVLVDDVSTMGGTLADLASYIQSEGGKVVGAVLLTNASRSGTIAPDAKTIRSLGERHGQAIKQLFGIEPSALTSDESQYLIGFRTTDELRNRAATASAERGRRIRSKDVSEPQDSATLDRSEPLASRPAQQPIQKNILRPANKSSMEADTSVMDHLLGAKFLFKGAGWLFTKSGAEAISSRAYTNLLERLGKESMADFIPEKVKAGMVSDYGLSGDYIDRKAEMKASEAAQNRKSAGLVEMLAALTRAESRVAYQWMQEKPDTATEQALLEKLPTESRETLARLKKMISDMGKDAVHLGQMSNEAYQRNNMAYLHRTYAKHVLDNEGVIGKMMRARALKIKGNQYKGRGIFDEIKMGSIGGDGVFWRKLQQGRADNTLVGEKLIRFERRDDSTDAMDALPGMTKKHMGKLREVIYWPESTPVPSKFGDWVNSGAFEVRDTKGDKLVVWRDFTPDERERMGELDEVRYAVAQTLQMMTHDIEVGRFFEWTAKTYGKVKPEGREAVASESMLHSFGKDDWVQVPSGAVPNTQTKKYGALAGLYIPGAVWNDIRQTAGTRIEPFGHAHEKVLQFWKKSKTAWSPAVHMNNVMANFVIADWHDLRAVDLAEALKVWANSGKDGYREIYQRFEDSGALGGMFLSNEALRDEIAKQLESIKAELTGEQEAKNEMARMAKVMHLVTMAGMVPVKGAKLYAEKMEDAYQFEDAIFRLAAFTKAIRYGKSDIEAGRIARHAFLNYDINAPWIQMARHTALPFVSFFYRALPMALNTVKSKPWKVAKLMAFYSMLSALGTMLSGGDDDEERKLLPKEKQGSVWGVVPKMVRMPWNHADDAPYFLDIRRWVPVGDVADMEMGSGMLPPWATPGGPLIMFAEMLVANKSFFTEKDIVQDTDTQGEKLEKRLDHLFKGMLPNVPLPNPLNLQTPSGEINPLGLSQGSMQSYAWSGIEKSTLKREGIIGEVRNTPAAIASAFGVKVSAYPAGNMKASKQIILRKQVEEIKDSMKKIQRNYGNLEQPTDVEQARFAADIERQRTKLKELTRE